MYAEVEMVLAKPEMMYAGIELALTEPEWIKAGAVLILLLLFLESDFPAENTKA